jgi:predicted SAM-dependent methyltransferase
MPSLKHLVAAYESGNWRNQDWLRTPEFQFIETPAEMLNISFRWWGHRCIYDIYELGRRLLDAGFARIAEAPWGDSRDDSLRSLETRADSKLICVARK